MTLGYYNQVGQGSQVAETRVQSQFILENWFMIKPERCRILTTIICAISGDHQIPELGLHIERSRIHGTDSCRTGIQDL